jgi:hypothetical protein
MGKMAWILKMPAGRGVKSQTANSKFENYRVNESELGRVAWLMNWLFGYAR